MLMFFVNMFCFFIELHSAMYLMSLFSLALSGFALFYAVKSFVEWQNG